MVTQLVAFDNPCVCWGKECICLRGLCYKLYYSFPLSLPNGGYYVYYPLNTFQHLGKMFMNSLLFMVWVYFSMLSEMILWTRVTCSLFYNNHTMLFILNQILNTEFSILDIRFKDWGISLEVYHRMSPSFSRRIFCHVMGLRF